MHEWQRSRVATEQRPRARSGNATRPRVGRRQGDETLNSMSPPSGENSMGERAGVEKFEVVLELEA